MPEPHRPSEIGAVVRARRIALGLTQEELAKAIGTKQSYVSRIESGARQVLQVGLRLRLARALELAPEAFEEPEYAEGATSPLSAAEARRLNRVASIAREAGHPSDAAAAAGDVVARLPSRDLTSALAAARAEALLVRAVALGDIREIREGHPGLVLLNEAYQLAKEADDTTLAHAVTLKIGNELRKAHDPRAAKHWLELAVTAAPNAAAAQASRIALIRVLGELREASQSAEPVRQLRAVEDSPEIWSPTLHPLSAAEAEARHLLTFRRAVRADVREQLASLPQIEIAPQWKIIARLTLAEAQMAQGEDDEALSLLTRVIQETREIDALPRLRTRGLDLLEKNRVADDSLRHEFQRTDK